MQRYENRLTLTNLIKTYIQTYIQHEIRKHNQQKHDRNNERHAQLCNESSILRSSSSVAVRRERQ